MANPLNSPDVVVLTAPENIQLDQLRQNRNLNIHPQLTVFQHFRKFEVKDAYPGFETMRIATAECELV